MSLNLKLQQVLLISQLKQSQKYLKLLWAYRLLKLINKIQLLKVITLSLQLMFTQIALLDLAK